MNGTAALKPFLTKHGFSPVASPPLVNAQSRHKTEASG
jgi:hypothetical protein